MKAFPQGAELKQGTCLLTVRGRRSSQLPDGQFMEARNNRNNPIMLKLLACPSRLSRPHRASIDIRDIAMFASFCIVKKNK